MVLQAEASRYRTPRGEAMVSQDLGICGIRDPGTGIEKVKATPSFVSVVARRLLHTLFLTSRAKHADP
eukprot:5949423-Lingulodinium_polyedra.AAC.1